MRKTVTSCEVKDRYNRKHYDQVILRTAKGGRDELQRIADSHGMSVNAYIRHLIIRDNAANADISAILGGGVIDYANCC